MIENQGRLKNINIEKNMVNYIFLYRFRYTININILSSVKFLKTVNRIYRIYFSN